MISDEPRICIISIISVKPSISWGSAWFFSVTPRTSVMIYWNDPETVQPWVVSASSSSGLPYMSHETTCRAWLEVEVGILQQLIMGILATHPPTNKNSNLQESCSYSSLSLGKASFNHLFYFFREGRCFFGGEGGTRWFLGLDFFSTLQDTHTRKQTVFFFWHSSKKPKLGISQNIKCTPGTPKHSS